mgnify:CR=1
MRHRLLIGGATLGVVALSVGLVVSGLPGAPTAPQPPALSLHAPSALARGVATVQPTSIDAVIVAFHKASADPAAMAMRAVRDAARAVAGAEVASARTLRSDTAEVRLATSVGRRQADRIAAVVQRSTPSVRYADVSARFSANDAGASDYYWNIDQVKAASAWSTTTGDNDIVVGVIDTGIGDNPLLPKALLLGTIDQKVSGRTISGTTWPGLRVSLTYVSAGSTRPPVSATADEHGTWSVTLPTVADDGSTLQASVTDGAQSGRPPVTALVNSSTHLTVSTPSMGTSLSGTVDPDSTVTLRYPDGSTQRATVSDDGAWTAVPTTPLADGDQVTVTATDAIGNIDPATIVIDRAISLVLDRSNGGTISGKTDPGAAVTIAADSGDPGCGTMTATDAGLFSCTPAHRLGDGVLVTATATDKAGNTTAASTTVDASPHLTVNTPSTGAMLSGTVDPDATVAVTYPDKSIQEATVTGTTWSAVPTKHLTTGATVTVTAVDSLKNSDSAVITIDRSVSLSVNPSNGTSITGTTDDDATLTFTDSSGASICPTQAANKRGGFSCNPPEPLADGTVVTVTATDPLGNATAASITVNASTNLQVNPSNGTTISGHVDPDATVTIRLSDSTPLCGAAVSVDSDGTFSCSPQQALSDGTSVTVTAHDTLGNTDERTVRVDAAAPTLTVNPSNGSRISGSTEPGAAIEVHDTEGLLCAGLTGDSSGAFSCAPQTTVADQETVTVTATDAAGNKSTAEVVIDGSAHLTVVSPSNAKAFSGTADADATVVLTYPDHSTQTAERDGTSWKAVPSGVELADGDVVTVRATDSLANADSASIRVDLSRPSAPEVSIATTQTISGVAEKDSTVTVTYQSADGSISETAVAAADGSWSFNELNPAPVIGSEATVTATDAAHNVSEPTMATIADVTPTPSTSPTPSEGSTPAPEAAPSANSVGTSQSAGVPLTGTTVGQGTVLPGYDFVSDDGDATDDAGSWHGTRVAGVIAANSSGLTKPTGVAPGVKIEPIRALGGTMVDVANAIAWGSGASTFFSANGTTTASHFPVNPYPADVLNLSLGAPYASCPAYLQSAIDDAVNRGTVVVVSAGNDSRSISAQAPANCKNVVVVTASTSAGSRASYSNWGSAASSSAWLIAAPGGSGDGSDCNEQSNWACTGVVVTPVGSSELGWAYGTSMAAPHVAAAAALMKSFDRTLSVQTIAAYLRATAQPLKDGCPTGTCGSGILDIGSALAAAATHANSGTSAAPTPPTNSYATTTVTVAWPSIIRVGTTLRAAAGNYATSYQWYRRNPDGTRNQAISGATGAKYSATATDYGKRLSVTVTVLGSVTASASTNVTTRTGVLQVLARPAITGRFVVGKSLSASRGSWSTSVRVTYQWLRNGKAISKQNRSTYRLSSRDRGKQISVRVTASASHYYSLSSTSARTPKVKR